MMAVVALGACGVCVRLKQTFAEEFRWRQQSIVEASSVSKPRLLICHVRIRILFR